MNIKGFAKTTLLDYPGHIASTIFTGGCNFNCPYCHNGDLVLDFHNMSNISEQEVLTHIKKRSSIIDGICISGGEPTLQHDLLDFMEKVKFYNLKIKLDTNGSNPHIIKQAYENNLVDYIAMDIKNSKQKYSVTCDKNINIDKIQQSIDYIIDCGINYEFRTTIVKEFHTENDIIEIGKWLNGSKQYFLQQYVERDKQIKEGLHSHNENTILEYAQIVKPYFQNVSIRGIDPQNL
ncbi:MAG: anaerobic ribonucleoside-triphosphate reductase activating protein [Vallitalea sp.]|jgi:pyruvate formate lyase activating enzyme|nr:anaerobic ribonucleoside-triphosphate reductase activating protein [Vallitalea sp.]